MTPPEEFLLWILPVWSERPQILAQFIFDIDNLSPGSLEPKGCPQNKLEYDCWKMGKNPKIQKKVFLLCYKVAIS